MLALKVGILNHGNTKGTNYGTSVFLWLVTSHFIFYKLYLTFYFNKLNP